MEQALFDDPICILLLCCFCWPGSERYRRAAALSGQQATLGFSLSPLIARRMTECLLVPLWNERARCCTVNAFLRDNRIQLGVLLSCGVSTEDTEVKRHGLPQEHCVCHYLSAMPLSPLRYFGQKDRKCGSVVDIVGHALCLNKQVMSSAFKSSILLD